MSSTETQAEKRIRLRRMKILADSEKRMNRIVSGSSEISSSSTTNCDSESNLSHAPSSEDHVSQICHQSSQSNVEKQTTSTILPPRDNESLPRKVSLISSPIHYKTLQLSKQYNSMLNHPNIVNNLRCNTSAKFMLLLILTAFVSSFFNANIPVLFIAFLMMKHAYNGFYRNIWFDININVLKELFTFMFSYIITQVTVKLVCN